MAVDKRPVVIVGAGIAGLTAALALAQRGIGSVVLERSAVLSEVGAGLQLSPNATRVLAGLGLADALQPVATAPDALVVRDARGGGEIVRLDLPAVASRVGSPYWVVHRGDLQAVLLSAATADPAIDIRLGAEVRAVEPESGGARVLAAVLERPLDVAARAVVGADGVRSWVRTSVVGGGPAAYSGRTAFRATFPAAAWTGDPDVLSTTGLWLGAKAHLVHYPIAAGRAVNLVAAVDDGWREEGWDVPADGASLDRFFSGWPPLVRQLLGSAESWRRWALCAAPADTPFARGPVALVGDAAHAMLPFVAQGGAMAIEDGAVLARCIVETPGPAAAGLARYADLRRPRVRRVVATAQRNATVYHLRGLAATARNLALGALGPAGLERQMDWIWSWRDAG